MQSLPGKYIIHHSMQFYPVQTLHGAFTMHKIISQFLLIVFNVSYFLLVVHHFARFDT